MSILFILGFYSGREERGRPGGEKRERRKEGRGMKNKEGEGGGLVVSLGLHCNGETFD